MLNFGQFSEAIGQTPASTTGTTVTANASPHTKGNYAQITAATTYPVVGMWIDIPPTSATNDYLLDIAIGGAGSEQVIIANIHIPSTHGGTAQGFQAAFPCEIPAGTRVSARIQSSGGGSTCIIVIHLLARSRFDGIHPLAPMQIVTTYGADTTISGGQPLDPGGTINTLGAYTQLTASLTYPMRGGVLAIGNQINTAPAAARWLVTLAIGTGGSEIPIWSSAELRAGTSTSQGGASMIYLPFSCPTVPAGERVAIACQCSINDATDRLLSAILYGFT